jgi:tetratricopeptide (TPR) repeat protein
MKQLGASCLLALGVLFVCASAWAQPATDAVQPVDVYLRSARIALATNPPEYARAQKNLEMARAHYPDNYEVHLLLGTVWAEKDEIDSMVTEYALAEKYAGPSEWQKRAKDIGKIVDSKWLERFNRGVNLLAQSDSLSETVPGIADSSKADSMKYRVGKVREMAREALRQCMLLKPKDFRASATRGIIYQRLAMADSAVADLKHAEDLFHRHEFMDSTTNWYDTTAFFTGAGEKTDAFKQFDNKYKKLSEEKRTRYNNLLRSLGAAYYDVQDWKNTIVITRRYLALFPKDVNSIVTLADCFSRLGNEAEAYKWQEITVTEDPNNKDTWYNLGIFYYNTAVRLQDSILAASKAIDRDRNDQAAKQARFGFLTTSLNNFAKAIPRFKKVVELDEKDRETWRLLGVCYYSVASLASDDQLNDDKSKRDEILNKVWQTMTSDPSGSYDQFKAWTLAYDILKKVYGFFPDDMAICKMSKISAAQLNKVDDLRELGQKCP